MLKKTLWILCLLSIGTRWHARCATQPCSDSLYHNRIECGVAELSEALADPEDEKCREFFDRWRRLVAATGADDPLIDTIYRAATDLEAVNRLGARLKPESPFVRYRLLAPAVYYILPDTIPFSLVCSMLPAGAESEIRMLNPDLLLKSDTLPDRDGVVLDPAHFSDPKHPDIPLTVTVKGPRGKLFYPLAAAPDSTLYMTEAYGEILYRTFRAYTDESLHKSRFERLVTWIPVEISTWGNCTYYPIMDIDYILLNESRTAAAVAFSGNDMDCYKLHLAPDDTGRWHPVRLEVTGTWIE